MGVAHRYKQGAAMQLFLPCYNIAAYSMRRQPIFPLVVRIPEESNVYRLLRVVKLYDSGRSRMIWGAPFFYRDLTSLRSYRIGFKPQAWISWRLAGDFVQLDCMPGAAQRTKSHLLATALRAVNLGLKRI
jgi:hypothetical protein